MNGGRLVFDPNADLAKLISKYVLINDQGSLEIGSSTCEFVGKAEIMLSGKSNISVVERPHYFCFFLIRVEK